MNNPDVELRGILMIKSPI